MSAPEREALTRLAEAVPRGDAGPVFDEPWQARAFALAVLLCERGHFPWREWTEVFAPLLRPSVGEARDEPRDYYRHWLTALETLAVRKRLAAKAELTARRSAWEEAHRRTPHGQPVELPRP